MPINYICHALFDSKDAYLRRSLKGKAEKAIFPQNRNF